MKNTTTDLYIYPLSSLLFSGDKLYKEGIKLNKRQVYNFEIEYITKSTGGMYINDVYYPVKPGDIIIRKPGDTTQGLMVYACYMIVFATKIDTFKNREQYVRHGNYLAEQVGSGGFISQLPMIYSSEIKDQLLGYFQEIHQLFKEEVELNDFRRKLLLEQLLLKLYDFQLETHQDALLATPYSNKINRVKAYMKEHLSEKIFLKDLANISQLSLFHFNRVFKKYEGVTPMAYLTQLRIDQSKSLLLSTNDSMTIISSRCGFESSSYYSHVFKKEVSITPKEYRKKYSYDG